MKLKSFWHQLWQEPKQPLPVVTTPYQAELERVQNRWSIALLLGVLALGWYLYQYTEHQAALEKMIPLVAAKSDIKAPQTLTLEDLIVINVPAKWRPNSSWERPEDLVGKTLKRFAEANQVLVLADVQTDLNPKSVSAQFETAFAFTMGENWFEAKLPNLKAQDTVDIITANPKAGLEATLTVASNLKVVSVESGSGRKNLVLNVNQSQAEALLFSRSLRLPMQVLLHSAQSQS